MTTKQSLFLPVTVIFLSIPFILPAQVIIPEAAASNIDAMLLERRLDDAQQAVERAIVAFDTSVVSPAVRSIAKNEAEEYRSFFRQTAEQMSVLDTSRIRSIVQPVLTVPERYTTPVAGATAEQAFRSLRTSWENNDIRTAFLYYKIANFTRTRFIVRSRFRYQTIFERVRAANTVRSTTETLILLDSLVAAESANPTAKVFSDSVSYWRRTLNDAMRTASEQERRYHSEEMFSRTAGIAVSVFPLVSSSLSNVHWTVRPDGLSPTVPVDLSEVGGASGVAGGLVLRYCYTPVVFQQWTAEYSTLKQGSVMMSDRQLTVGVKSTLLRFGTSVRYAFSATTGIRNFIGGGAGWQHVVRKEQKVYVGDIVFPDGGRLDHYALLEDGFSSADVSGEFGMEYIANADSDFFLDIAVGARYRLKQQSVDGAWTFLLTFQAGMFLW